LLDSILPEVDPETAQVAAQLLKKQGFVLHTGYVVKSAVRKEGQVEVVAVPREGQGDEKQFAVEKLLVAVGRRPDLEDLGLERLGVALTPKGFIQVDERMETSVKEVYAVGDAVGGKLLAHKASREGIVAAEAIAGRGTMMDYRAVPGSVFISPEVASVGLKEEEAKAQGMTIKVGKFLFRANGRALTLGESDGFVKIIADAETDQILGAHIIGPHASDLLAEVTAAMEFEGTAEDLASTIHIHPTLTEAVMEAAEAVHGQAVHMVNR
jgi:dihydrolipoamide dehydrogenase